MYKVYILNHDGEDIPYEDWSYVHTVFIGKPSKEEIAEVVGDDVDLDRLLGGDWCNGDSGNWYLETTSATLTKSFLYKTLNYDFLKG